MFWHAFRYSLAGSEIYSIFTSNLIICMYVVKLSNQQIHKGFLLRVSYLYTSFSKCNHFEIHSSFKMGLIKFKANAVARRANTSFLSLAAAFPWAFTFAQCTRTRAPTPAHSPILWASVLFVSNTHRLTPTQTHAIRKCECWCDLQITVMARVWPAPDCLNPNANMLQISTCAWSI